MLTLPIKKKWYDMIISGEKKEEYREIKPYYETRMQNTFGAILIEPSSFFPGQKYEILQGEEVPEEIRRGAIQKITFRNGYSATSPSFVAKCRLRVGEGRREWGAEPGVEYFILEIVEVAG
ncbi:MAG: ASCH domain-containing protein [Lachnospiraceae bacterium]